MEDTTLIQNILEGDKKSEQILYEKYKKILTDFLKNKYPQNSNYEDDISEILIKVFLSLPKYKPDKSQFKTWVFTIAKNYMIDKFKCVCNVNECYNTINLSDMNDTITVNNQSAITSNNVTYNYESSYSNTTSISDLNNFDNMISINYISDQLESCDFSFLNMHYVYGYTYSEIGSEFNTSSNTISNRVNYIKNKLKKNNVNENIF